ncbi:hypothetical protein Tdes44962_MAKER07115 [Teratosphaeria destructans]|uniref:Uncharacterized protein n=1 Tax=Teratosphaeria destructans TaxID=418781 RepID=A0A9W7SZQ5_9PEZI|nr:hypothetical protein Tdes44962_MAKER07115 [Teratosphaeria destructans]
MNSDSTSPRTQPSTADQSIPPSPDSTSPPPSLAPSPPAIMSVSWANNLPACFTLALLFDEDEYKHATTLEQRADLFNSIFDTSYPAHRLRDTWTSRKLQGRGKQWWKITNEDRFAPGGKWSEPDQAEKDRRRAIRDEQRVVVEAWMRRKGIEDQSVRAFITVRRNFRRCLGADQPGPYHDHSIADLTFALDTKEKLIAELIRGGILDDGTTDATFHLGSGTCDELREVSELVCVEGTDNDVTPGKLKGRIVHVHPAR